MTADADPIACGSCGARPDAAGIEGSGRAPLTWTRSTERGRTVWTCVDCSRRHLRAIEGKLDSDWC